MAAIFLATIIRSTFGFGEALVAVPLLALVVPVEIAAPVAVLASITIAFIAVVQDWRHIHLRSASWLVLSTLIGIPIGLWLLKAVPGPIVKGGLAIVIAAFSTYSLISKHKGELKNEKLSWIFGFAAGIMGGAYGMNGPPLVIYGSLSKWSPQHFRATLQGYFLPASVVGMFGYWVAGLWAPTVSRLYLLALPAIVVATFLGRLINRSMNAMHFLFYVHAGLILIGCALLWQSIRQ
jgi:hypothetical protein